ncbi:MAG: sigma-54-dependent Fis family transcriptional regulator [Desulfobacteraceae bacterium]|nr:MAG: sigma-54-dependent Fis family transcriptional regulator [Desulfobacteraceae bacterium]
MLIRILLALEPAKLRKRFDRLIADPHTLVLSYGGKTDIWNELAHQSCDLVILNDAAIPGSIEVLAREIRKLPDQPEVVVISDQENPEERAKLLAAGCYAVIFENLPDIQISAVLNTLMGRKREEGARRFHAQWTAQKPGLRDFLSLSPTMQSFMTIVHKVVTVDSSLLILGETGVGKERLASALHNEGPRSRGPFIHLNCAALPETLLESEMFGHVEGAFTGALRTRRGHFELAHKGTIFLDEIGDLPLQLQAKLLRVLQDRIISPLGSEKNITVDVRIIAATNRELESEMKAKRFREDLYYRLSVVSLKIPPLRQRREDIPQLLDHFIKHFCFRFNRPLLSLNPKARQALVAYSWPGNVRELINIIERAVLLSTGEEILLSDLPEFFNDTITTTLSGVNVSATPDRFQSALDIPWAEARVAVLTAFEKEYLTHLLQKTRGRIGEAARQAGIAPRSLYEKMQRCGLQKQDFRRKTPLPL